MWQKSDEPPRSECSQGLVPLHSSAEPSLLGSSPLPPLFRSTEAPPPLSLSLSTLSCLETNYGLIVLLLGCDVGGGGSSYVLEDFPAGFHHRQETFRSITLR